MHSSRMCTVRCSGRLGGGGAAQGGGFCLKGGGVSAQRVSGRRPLLPVDRMTGVKTLPCRNYVADGNERGVKEFICWLMMNRLGRP